MWNISLVMPTLTFFCFHFSHSKFIWGYCQHFDSHCKHLDSNRIFYYSLGSQLTLFRPTKKLNLPLPFQCIIAHRGRLLGQSVWVIFKPWTKSKDTFWSHLSKCYNLPNFSKGLKTVFSNISWSILWLIVLILLGVHLLYSKQKLFFLHYPQRIRKRQYKSRDEFKADIEAIVGNSTLYNGAKSPLTMIAQNMLSFCEKKMAEVSYL